MDVTIFLSRDLTLYSIVTGSQIVKLRCTQGGNPGIRCLQLSSVSPIPPSPPSPLPPTPLHPHDGITGGVRQKHVQKIAKLIY